MIVCRRVEDSPHFTGATSVCETCSKPVYVEDGLETLSPKICLACCYQQHPSHVIFAERPPDEFGRSSISVSVQQVFEAHEGQWHKNGVWHDQQWVLNHAEG